MADDVGSTVVRRQLGRYLRGLRERARLSQDEAATALDCSRQKIWRVESGAVPVRSRDVKVLCNLYAAGSEVTRELAALALETGAKGWWHAYGDVVPGWFSLYVGLEIVACRLRHYNGELVPALLRTAPYAAAIQRNRPNLTDVERNQLTAVEVRRRALLDRQSPAPPRLDVVLSEAVLHRRIGDRAGMLGQLRHLDQVGTRPNVSLRILPLDAGPTLASEAGAFTVLDFPSGEGLPPIEPTTVYRESLTGALYLDRPVEVAAYEEAWSGLDGLALNKAESSSLIKTTMAEWNR
jgi:transcriptional regulator with XRE-family HTH domain